jgi:hypothetical protein
MAAVPAAVHSFHTVCQSSFDYDDKDIIEIEARKSFLWLPRLLRFGSGATVPSTSSLYY